MTATGRVTASPAPLSRRRDGPLQELQGGRGGIWIDFVAESETPRLSPIRGMAPGCLRSYLARGGAYHRTIRIAPKKATSFGGPILRSSAPRARRPHCLAGHVRFELRNVVANYPFERSHRFPGIKPNSGHRDYSRFELRRWGDAARPAGISAGARSSGASPTLKEFLPIQR